MKFAKAVAQAPGTGLCDSSLNCPALLSPLVTDQSTFFLTPLVRNVIEEPIALLVFTDEKKCFGGRNFYKTYPAVLSAGEVRPYTAEEMQKFAGTEFASGKALHTFVGHYRQPGAGSLSLSVPIKEGYGAIYFADGSFFLGNWSNNQRCGIGAMYSSTGYAYEGEFKDDIPHGRGVEYFPRDQSYVGEFVEGRPHGFGVTYCHRNGFIHAGNYLRGAKHGSGVVFYANGDVFEGHWDFGRRSGEGISTNYEVRDTPDCTGAAFIRQCTRGEWQCDQCDWKTLRDDAEHKPPSLEEYIETGIIQPFESIESPIGYSIETLSVADELVRDIPPVLLRRLERCFDLLDDAFTGEVPFAVFEMALDSFPPLSAEKALRSILRMAEECSHDDSLVKKVNFFSFLWGLFPHLNEAEIERSVVQEFRLEVLLRLRGELAGVSSGKKDGFLQVAQASGEDEVFFTGVQQRRRRSGGRGGGGGHVVAADGGFYGGSSINKKRGVTQCKKREVDDDVEAVHLTIDQLDAGKGFVGGVRVPRALFLRQKVLYGKERLDFSAFLEGLYPCVSPQAVRRCEVTFFSPHVFHGYAREFSRLDDAQRGLLSIEAMVTARRRFLMFRGKGHDRIPQPLTALERHAVSGRQRSHVLWEVADIALSVTVAQYIDRSKTGSVALADVLRYAYPNVPCMVTRSRLMHTTAGPRHASNDMEFVGHSDGGAAAADVNGLPIVPPLVAPIRCCCSCCICTLCTASLLPLGGTCTR